MDNNGTDNGDRNPNPDETTPVEPTTGSGWVVVKEAPTPAKPPVAKAQSSSKVTRNPGTAPTKRSSGKRELIDTGRNKMYAKRGVKGRFKEMDDVSRSLSADRRQTAKKKTKSGHGDQGDGARAKGKRKPAGSKTAGRKTAGRKTAGSKTAGRKTAGRKTAGRKTVARKGSKRR